MAEASGAETSRDLVQIRALGKNFESRKGLFGRRRSLAAVSDVTLDIPRGKVTGVVGESGCGKSTLARLVVRLLRPSAGRVTPSIRATPCRMHCSSRSRCRASA
jgi:ABC-type oligopeptide transport system ATPase subunit